MALAGRLALSPVLTPSAVKALIEKRNERFRQAVDECSKFANCRRVEAYPCLS